MSKLKFKQQFNNYFIRPNLSWKQKKKLHKCFCWSCSKHKPNNTYLTNPDNSWPWFLPFYFSACEYLKLNLHLYDVISSANLKHGWLKSLKNERGKNNCNVVSSLYGNNNKVFHSACCSKVIDWKEYSYDNIYHFTVHFILVLLFSTNPDPLGPWQVRVCHWSSMFSKFWNSVGS